MKLRVTQWRFKRFDLLPVRPTESLLDFGQGSPHLKQVGEMHFERRDQMLVLEVDFKMEN